ncbi:MAG: nucleotidyltransferase domain-containing protein [Chloroflexi bacterium]|nr:nucleotidyltransferase domain-containing protein [Chloroflexota bacterium]
MPSESFGSLKVFSPQLSRAELVARLREQLPTLAESLPLRRVVLFGSWARGRATAFSDVDLLVVYADPPRDDAYGLVRRHLRLRGLEPHVYTEAEAARVQETLDRMTRDGVSLM